MFLVDRTLRIFRNRRNPAAKQSPRPLSEDQDQTVQSTLQAKPFTTSSMLPPSSSPLQFSNRPPRKGFNDLSNEILLEIIEWVGCRDNRLVRDIARCSRLLHTLALPTLHSNFTSGTLEDDLSRLCAYVENPSLGSYVRTFSSQWYNSDGTGTPDQLGYTAVVCSENIMEICDTMEEVDQWLSDVLDRDWNAIVALFLTCLPRLEYLALKTIIPWADSYVHKVFTKSAALQSQDIISPFSLSKLGSVWIMVEPGLFPSFDDALPFIKLNSVKEASFRGLSLPCSTDETSTLELDSLRMDICRANGDQLIRFLGRFKTLKAFHRSHIKCTTCSKCLPPKYMDALSHLKGSLETLELHVAPSDILDPKIRIESLKDFQRLESLSLSSELLVTIWQDALGDGPQLVHRLPDGLKNLELLNYDATTVALLIEFFRTAREPRSLSSITLEGYAHQSLSKNADLAQMVAYLSAECMKADVDFTHVDKLRYS